MSLPGWGTFQRTLSPQTVQASLKVIVTRVGTAASATANCLGYLAFRHGGGRQA